MQYLYDLNDPKNFIAPITMKAPDGHIIETQHTILMPDKPRRHFTMTDSIMMKTRPGSIPNSHEHHVGYEIFFLDSGGMDIFIDGQKTYVKPGSIMLVQPYQAHGSTFYEDTKYRGFFHDLPYNDEGDAGLLLREHNPDYMNDPDFPKEIAPLGDFYLREPHLDYAEVPPEQCRPIRHRERPMATFNLPGVTMKMITGRWEHGGLCEIWCFEMKKGFFAESYQYPANTDLYYVIEGKVKFKVYEEEFTAKEECLVKIPKYAPRSFDVLEDAVVYDVGGMPRWDAYMTDRASVLEREPERAALPETFDELRKKFGIPYCKSGVR